ncbi:phospholipase A(1) LCAT3-like isoform X1 [Ananas comosus]|uniref:Phospholipase A(1) LCAT3-like isoform X1 n=1 Tax=Ananas comosus TaxID=4615 RepID=A0A6P5EXL6_ANACO|nr:phospholipase A(1) LCAT3-like isoform X1 [Ananas comosus]
MFGDCGLRIPWLRRRRRRRRSGGGGGAGVEPVLLVSGMGGSILNARSKRSKRELRAWVRVFLANLEFKKYLWSMYNADTGYTEPLDSDVEICVPEDEYGLQAIDILDPSWWVKLLRVTDVYHFHDMIDMLVECGYEKGTTLFGYGYDFRQSSRIEKTMMGLKEKLETAYKASGGQKVNVISHSMGGLLVRCFMSLHNDVFAMYVNKWICIACPFQGAPGCINDSLLTGLQFVYGFESFFFVSRWNMHQLLVECPSIYEMLPYSNFKWNQQPLVQVWRKLSGENEEVKLQEYDATNCVSLFEEALRDNKLDYNGKSIPLPFNYSIFKWATDTRQILDNAQLPSAVSFYNIYGISLDTPYNVCYGSESSPIGDLSEICHTMMVHFQPQYEYVDGDGTVPTESAKADGFAATARVGIKASHRGLLNDERVFQLLKQWLGAGEKSRQQPMSTSKVMDFSQESIPFQMAP